MIANLQNVAFFLLSICVAPAQEKEELLLSKERLEQLWKIRKAMPKQSDGLDISERFVRYLKKTENNEAFYELLQEEMFKK